MRDLCNSFRGVTSSGSTQKTVGTSRRTSAEYHGTSTNGLSFPSECHRRSKCLAGHPEAASPQNALPSAPASLLRGIRLGWYNEVEATEQRVNGPSTQPFPLPCQRIPHLGSHIATSRRSMAAARSLGHSFMSPCFGIIFCKPLENVQSPKTCS